MGRDVWARSSVGWFLKVIGSFGTLSRAGKRSDESVDWCAASCTKMGERC
jgi:hypothetical protein